MHQKIKSFTLQCVRVWRLLRRPSRQEYLTVLKVSAIGILVLGLIGFTISEIMHLFL